MPANVEEEASADVLEVAVHQAITVCDGEPNRLVAEVHDRMPVVLGKGSVRPMDERRAR